MKNKVNRQRSSSSETKTRENLFALLSRLVFVVDFFASSLFRLTHSPIFCACACADASSSTSTSSDSSSCTGRSSSVGVGVGVAVGSVVVDGDCVRCILSLTLETSLNLALIFRCFILFPPLFFCAASYEFSFLFTLLFVFCNFVFYSLNLQFVFTLLFVSHVESFECLCFNSTCPQKKKL